MKRYKYYFMLAVMLVAFTQCDSLDMSPDSSITDANYWKTEAHFSAFNIGLHAKMRDVSYNYFLLGEPRANLYCENNPFGGEAFEGVQELPHNTINKENPGISNFAALYPVINQLNLMISKTSANTFLSEADKNYYLGEAYGMRAYLYFHLLRSWGDVVIHTDPTDGATIDISKLAKAASPATQVMELIKSDIEASEKAFGDDYNFKYGRHYWSLPATLMLKGDVYLWSGKQMGGGSADYQTAKAALQEVSKADVTLINDFASVFAYTNKKNKEIIFTFHSQKDEFNMWKGSYSGVMLPQDNYMVLYFDENGNSFANQPAAEKLRGLVRFQVNYDLYHTAFRDDDIRKRETLKATYLKNEAGELTYIAPFANKFKGTLIEGNASVSLLDDYPIYRYADCLLLLATAKALLSEDISSEINQIRERAYGSEYFQANRDKLAYPNDTDAAIYSNNKYVGSDADPFEAILKERLREFMFEGKRWYDLRLLGEPYIYKYSKAQSKRLLWPINEGALTNNRDLVQTPGYE